MAATLSVWEFDTSAGADEAHVKVDRLQDQELVAVSDGAIVSWEPGTRKLSDSLPRGRSGGLETRERGPAGHLGRIEPHESHGRAASDRVGPQGVDDVVVRSRDHLTGASLDQDAPSRILAETIDLERDPGRGARHDGPGAHVGREVDGLPVGRVHPERRAGRL